MTAHVRVSFLEAVRDATGGNSRVQRKTYLSEGPVPVVDQGKDLIAGYTTADNAYTGQLPVVLFGDHTRMFKYVDFPFAVGADGVKVLVPQEGFDASFLYWYFRCAHIPSAGYARHFKFLRELLVCKPPLVEQRRIAGILNRAAKIERLRTQAQELMGEFLPALFVRMFGDPVENPMGWEIAALGDLCDMDRRGIDPDDPIALDIPFVGVENVKSDSGVLDFCNSSRIGNPRSITFRFDSRHILYGKLRPYLNKVATPAFSGRCSTELVPLLPRNGVDREFVAYLLRRKETIEYAMASVTGSRMPRTDMQALMLLPVPSPPLKEQRRFARIVKCATRASAVARTASITVSALTASLMSHLLESNE